MNSLSAFLLMVYISVHQPITSNRYSKHLLFLLHRLILFTDGNKLQGSPNPAENKRDDTRMEKGCEKEEKAGNGDRRRDGTHRREHSDLSRGVRRRLSREPRGRHELTHRARSAKRLRGRGLRRQRDFEPDRHASLAALHFRPHFRYADLSAARRHFQVRFDARSQRMMNEGERKSSTTMPMQVEAFCFYEGISD